MTNLNELKQYYSQYSIDELAKSFKVSELRKICSKIEIKKVNREGEEIPINKGRKNELVKLIYETCKSLKVNNSSINEYENYETQLDDIANEIYNNENGLKKVFTETFSKQLVFNPDLLRIANQLKSTLEIVLSTKKVDYSPSTLLNYKSQIMKRLEVMTINDFDNLKNEITEQFNLFTQAVQGAFKPVSVKKREVTNTNINTRQNDAIEIKVSNLIKWAKNRLEKLPKESARWREVAIALMIVTGRRQSEIMATGEFTIIDDDHVLFEGQLKRHTDEDVESFEIPTLVKSQLVIDGVNWLNSNNKREDDPKKAHNRFSRYLSVTAKEICNSEIKVINGEWEYKSENGKDKDRRTCHIFRQIYGQVAYKIFCPKTRKISQFLTDIMGHSNSPSSRNWAASNYDSDIVINDNFNQKTNSKEK